MIDLTHASDEEVFAQMDMRLAGLRFANKEERDQIQDDLEVLDAEIERRYGGDFAECRYGDDTGTAVDRENFYGGTA